MLHIRNHQTGEVASLVRDVCHEHPAWVHQQLETESEAELQGFLDCCDQGEFEANRGREDAAGVFLPVEEA